MTELMKNYRERKSEILNVLKLLKNIDKCIASSGRAILSAKLSTPPSYQINAVQQKILYSSIYLMLYNLVEGTVNQCIAELLLACKHHAKFPINLSPKLLDMWINDTAGVTKEINEKARAKKVRNLFDIVSNGSDITEWEISKGGGGKWRHTEIKSYCEKIGLELRIPRRTLRAINRHIKDDKGVLGMVVDLRNKLAHGDISFAQCAASVVYRDLVSFCWVVFKYLESVVSNFGQYIDSKKYLKEDP
ncbi:MAE_28990/MAE_18760 family HEPN-like nuclease [Bartonella sp. HY038]|uniref:MAE_28990/MAE_18760 family HEPN-like nuclease n=1 Tax=Bartonella sp. HY038 TaxID=2759660 RepID=UPI0015FC929A|nr:MAE_28990/MAE_18760 family HEPN-like nuclease [Bartonella sp. HY038]